MSVDLAYAFWQGTEKVPGKQGRTSAAKAALAWHALRHEWNSCPSRTRFKSEFFCSRLENLRFAENLARETGEGGLWEAS